MNLLEDFVEDEEDIQKLTMLSSEYREKLIMAIIQMMRLILCVDTHLPYLEMTADQSKHSIFWDDRNSFYVNSASWKIIWVVKLTDTSQIYLLTSDGYDSNWEEEEKICLLVKKEESNESIFITNSLTNNSQLLKMVLDLKVTIYSQTIPLHLCSNYKEVQLPLIELVEYEIRACVKHLLCVADVDDTPLEQIAELHANHEEFDKIFDLCNQYLNPEEKIVDLVKELRDVVDLLRIMAIEGEVESEIE